MYRAAVIADDSLAPVFRALGFDAYAVSGPVQARRAWDRIQTGTYAVVFVTESVHRDLEPELAELRASDREFPIVTMIPGPEGASERGLAELKARVEKAIGVDILFKGEEQ